MIRTSVSFFLHLYSKSPLCTQRGDLGVRFPIQPPSGENPCPVIPTRPTKKPPPSNPSTKTLGTSRPRPARSVSLSVPSIRGAWKTGISNDSGGRPKLNHCSGFHRASRRIFKKADSESDEFAESSESKGVLSHPFLHFLWTKTTD